MLVEPTRIIPHRHSPISTLDDDVFLNIFYLYRLDIGDEGDDEGIFVRRWDRQRWWYKLAQVSQHWRSLILRSPSRLDLHLLCTYGVPVAEMLVHSPPLPITIFYNDRFREMTTEDEDGILLAILQRDRVRRMALKMPASNVQKLIPAMGGQFPILGRLSFKSQTNEDISLILPKEFQAPNLRHIDFWRVALPMRSPILSNTVGLVHLWLGRTPGSAYFTPNYILTRLSLMPQLETLGIGFYSPLPNRDVVRQLLGAPVIPHVTLPRLRLFSFRGVSAYLEALLTRITAPVLNTLALHLFNQLTFTAPYLLRFLQLTENIIFHAVGLTFDRDCIQLLAHSNLKPLEHPFGLRVTCRNLDWQVASAAQILGTLSPVLSGVEKLTLKHVKHDLSSAWHDDVDSTQWRELLIPFSNVKSLHVESDLVKTLSRSLRCEDGELHPRLEVLPNLEELVSGSDVGDVFTPFINERRAAGYSVRLASDF